MSLKRLFIGIFVDEIGINNNLNKLKADFDKVTFGKWVEPNNLHFTVKFLGDTESGIIPDIKNALDGILVKHDVALSCSGLSTLPQRGLPRVLYAAIESPDNYLLKTSIEIESNLEQFGYKSDNREFKPHVTLLRMKSVSNDFRSVLKKYSNFNFGNMDSFDIKLVESKLTPSGPIYKII